MVRPRDQDVPKRLARRGLEVAPRESDPEVNQGSVCVITSHNLLVPVLVWHQQNHNNDHRLLKTVNLGLLHLRSSPEENRVSKVNEYAKRNAISCQVE